jgi:NADPH2:quinone reductase
MNGEFHYLKGISPAAGYVLSVGVSVLCPEGETHHGTILREAAALAEGGKLWPLLNKQRFSSADIDAAHSLVESGALGKVVVDL